LTLPGAPAHHAAIFREGFAMAVRGYVLIETEVGKAKAVSSAIGALSYEGARVVTVDTVTGPFDVIVQLEADDLDRLGNAITDALQRVSGVQRTTTCLAVRLA
jgi:DNA-binding Lrp family transcriptional regulator